MSPVCLFPRLCVCVRMSGWVTYFCFTCSWLLSSNQLLAVYLPRSGLSSPPDRPFPSTGTVLRLINSRPTLVLVFVLVLHEYFVRLCLRFIRSDLSDSSPSPSLIVSTDSQWGSCFFLPVSINCYWRLTLLYHPPALDLKTVLRFPMHHDLCLRLHFCKSKHFRSPQDILKHAAEDIQDKNYRGHGLVYDVGEKGDDAHS